MNDAIESGQKMPFGGAGADVMTDDQARAEIADILADGSLSLDEKRARLEDFRSSQGTVEAADAEAYAPLEHQVMHALSMLADGGHDYSEKPGSSDTPDLAHTPDDDAHNRI